MAVAAARKATRQIGPESNGVLMTPREFDRADFDDFHRFELINGVLIVSPIPAEGEASPNDELGFLLRCYRKFHPQGSALNETLPERLIAIGTNRRRPDRVIWAGLGRPPRKGETPTILAEFVSKRKRDQILDYEVKRLEYFKIPVQEYWIIDRFRQIMTVFHRSGGKIKKKVLKENQVYRTDLLPGFELPIADLLRAADQWPDEEGEED